MCKKTKRTRSGCRAEEDFINSFNNQQSMCDQQSILRGVYSGGDISTNSLSAFQNALSRPPIIRDAVYKERDVDLAAPKISIPIDYKVWYQTKPNQQGRQEGRQSSDIDMAVKWALDRQKTKMKNVYKASGNKEQRRSLLLKFLADSQKLANTTGEEFTMSEEARSVGIVNNEETSA